ncbi:ATPase, partial [Streptomyces sp. SID10116]|nr:ATPase [Streptomyces sp. SID10116]
MCPDELEGDRSMTVSVDSTTSATANPAAPAPGSADGAEALRPHAEDAFAAELAALAAQ